MSIADKLRLIANNVQKVFDGGRKAEYDAFWDSFQKNGAAANYAYSFGIRWTDETFKPKHDIIITGVANYTFGNSPLTNLKQTLIECGVSIDFSLSTGLYATFSGMAQNIALPVIDMSNASDVRACFSNNSALVSVDKIIFSERLSNVSNMFQNCKSLENVIFEGTLACSGLDVSACKKLTVESLRSILRVLSTNGSGKAITFATVHQSIIESDAECSAYASAATSAGWTIAYN